MRDADFSSKTKRIIAARAGFRCSFPDCDEATIGPGIGACDIASKGVAAHIFAASAGGPRGDGGLSASERQAPANGIWLCQDHGRLFDEEKGKSYPASTLQSWKGLQEQRIANELNKTCGPSIGWLSSVEIGSNPIFKAQTRVDFSKVTLLVGPNGTGKTALCEWLAGAAGDPTLLERWARMPTTCHQLEVMCELIIPSRHEFAFAFDGKQLSCRYDAVPVTDLGKTLRVKYLREVTNINECRDDVEYLARTWGIHRYQVEEVLSTIGASKYGFIKHAELRTEVIEQDDTVTSEPNENGGGCENERQEVYAQIGLHQSPISYRMLSGREQSQVIVSGAMVLADRESRQGPVILIVELGQQLLPDQLLTEYTKRLADPRLAFQTILVSPSDRPKVDWSGWSIARLSGDPPQVVIGQETIAS